ncbi:hypothetical protein [Legionella sp.]|uniref:hypothetical protein n=1 Tax=Legionella sp. TaxID=459 RepID=UPI000CB7CFD8|nr:hypothetical protein [Legionella sp.]PJE07036.1 MAG: hypothetical protein CK430_14460 [Legionella sp.]
MREAYNCQSNTSLAKKLFSQLKRDRHILTYIPSFDSFNPFFDCIHLTEKQSQQQKGLALDRFDVLDAVNPMFEQLIAEFNEIDQPYIVDIASFIKSMILLHPFPNRNGRVFTLGILNQLLLKNKFGICLNLEPQITLLSSAEIAEAIKANLIKLDEFKFEVDNSVAFKATCSELFNWFRQLREANVNNERLLAELEGMHRGLAQADTLKALSILKGTCEKIIELSSNHEINYPGNMPTAVFVLNTLEKQSGKNAFDSSYDSKEKNVFVLLMLSKSYIVHLKEELMLETKLRSHEEISRANPEDFNEQPITKLTLQKYQSVTRLCDSLEGEGNAIDKLKLFKQEFARNKTLLETRRDDAGITFLKIVLTIVTFSAAYFLGIWETKGKQFGNEVEALTNPMFNQ